MQLEQYSIMRAAGLPESFPRPRRATPGSAGLDMPANLPAPVTIPPGGQAWIGTGYHFAIPYGYAGLLLPRSGLGTKYQTQLANTAGVIDSDYRGEVRACLVNRGAVAVTIEPGEYFAQLVVTGTLMQLPQEVAQLPPSERRGGFGSTGRH